ncbi:MAG: type II toxin-antitoxin system VapC family toxin [Bryobacterales bacterium]|nr:type II toxin-antitoxin system VapC family toxin [Bryobacterales bacterium]
MTILVDSDVLIEVSRGRDKSIVSEWLDLSVSEARILVSAVTVTELLAGARPAEHETLEALFEALVCVPADVGIGRRAGEYLRTCRKSHGVELADALIAATAVESEAMLWTRNRQRYPMKDLSFFPGGKS